MQNLIDLISPLISDGLCVAFSGGVDSSLLLKIACDIAKKQSLQVYAVTFETKLHPHGDLDIAKKVANELGAVHHIIQVDELSNIDIQNNPIDRCYRCKKYLFQTLVEFANQNNIKNIIDGTNYDDIHEYRPGIKALNELNIISPLVKLQITKARVREMATSLGISVAKRPSAPCLATRLPYNTDIDYAVLEKIEQGETFLKTLGFHTNRIRLHGDIVRIEILEQFEEFIAQKDIITTYLQNLGFIYITLDIQGFRSGSMDINIATWILIEILNQKHN